MKQRCSNAKSRAYKNYGGRGIKVCDLWLESFENFYADMGPRPGPEYSLDRIDVNGHYEPGNCRWATYEEQQNNRRDTIYLTLDGETRSLGDWSEIVGLPRKTIAHRLEKGWSDEKALKTPTYDPFDKHDTRWVEWEGIRTSLGKLCRERNLPRDIIRSRIDKYGWTLERALTTPVKSRKK